MFTLEVFNGEFWEGIPDIFDTAEDAKLYYMNQIGGFEDFRITEEEEWTPENADFCDPGSIHHY
jgi:hypothetical protein